MENQNNNQKSKWVPYIRSIFFGIEDSLVSTVGLLSGVAAAGVPNSTILLTGIVLIFVEAFSMGVGSMITEHEVAEYQTHREVGIRQSLGGGLVMLLSYMVAGLIPLFPYTIMTGNEAVKMSVGLTLISLFLLGALGAKFFRTNILKHGLQMLVLGGTAIALGIIVGRLVGHSIIN